MTPGDINNASAVLQVSSKVNEDLYMNVRRNSGMVDWLEKYFGEEAIKRYEMAGEKAAERATKQAVEQATKRATEQATETTTQNAVVSIMETLHLTLDQALDALQVEPEKRASIIAKIQ